MKTKKSVFEKIDTKRRAADMRSICFAYASQTKTDMKNTASRICVAYARYRLDWFAKSHRPRDMHMRRICGSVAAPMAGHAYASHMRVQ